MDRSLAPRELKPFIDENGRLCRWPARQKVQRMALDALVLHFDPAREYAERDVNFLLMEWHTFGDWAMLRRMLVDWRYLDRQDDGTRYRRRLDDGATVLPDEA